ncbi:MFS transporter [Rhizobium sp. AAP43]|uniref:MFS transporter n=1 Tax=Rhizobium sp. AAP43 TaxID=1523420 RepID=UPI0006B9B884|nr:MFS transporter [Rhizobium sp. AAP43]KPF43655.1 MFS transporter [Rhizobium sp. AAP43]
MNRITPLILAVALFMEQMDSTVIATALPTIATDLGVGPITLKLALTAYMVALAIFIPISGWMADRYGAKRVFRAAIVIFMLGSLFCAMSGSLLAFIAARFLQGMGGAMMTPVGRLVLLRTTKKSELVSAMALLTIPGLLGPITGPPIGGFITTFFSWHWIFLINLPIGLLGLWISGLYLPEIAPIKTGRIDWRGFTLSAGAASGLVFGLSVMSLPALPVAVGAGATVAGILCLVLYVIHARRHPAPLLNLSLFTNRSFRASIIGGTLFRIAAGATPFLLPLMLQLGFGMSAFQSGMVTFVAAIGAISTKFIVRRAFAALGFRTVLITAGIIGALTTGANALFTPATPILLIMGILLLGGFCRSFFFTGVNTLGYSEIEDGQASQATALTSVLQQVSLALGVAVAGAILEVSAKITGGTLSLGDFHLAFAMVAALSIFAVIPFFGLARDVGSAVSGYRHGQAEDDTISVK